MIRDDDNNIVYEKCLSTESAVNIDLLNGKFININYHPTYWFNISLPVKSKWQAYPEEAIVVQFTSWTKNKSILMNAV